MMKIIINADDFGFSHGINLAVRQGHLNGVINSTSLMINQKYTSEAVEMSRKMPELPVGLHLNLTNGFALSSPDKISWLADENGNFNCGFVKLLLRTLFFPRKMKYQLWREMVAQVQKMESFGLKISHLDGHRHIQMIPLIYKIAEKLCAKYHIARMRIINENIFHSWKTQGKLVGIKNGGVIKYIVLRCLTLYLKCRTPVYFFSILCTCRITPECMRRIRIPAKYQALEIMLHPGMPEVDKKDLSGVPDENILSSYRALELKAALDKNILKELERNDRADI